MNCDAKGCTHEAKWSPIVQFYAPATYQDAPPIEVKIGLKLCDKDRDEFDLDSMRADLEDLIAMSTRAFGRVTPDFSRTRVRFEDWRVVAEHLGEQP